MFRLFAYCLFDKKEMILCVKGALDAQDIEFKGDEKGIIFLQMHSALYCYAMDIALMLQQPEMQLKLYTFFTDCF